MQGFAPGLLRNLSTPSTPYALHPTPYTLNFKPPTAPGLLETRVDVVVAVEQVLEDLGHYLACVLGVEGVGAWVSGFGLGFRVQGQIEDRARLLGSGSRISSPA